MKEGLGRFKKVRSWHVNRKQFNVDTFDRQQRVHVMLYDMQSLRPMGQTYANVEGRRSADEEVILQTVPLFTVGEYSFFVDPADPLQGGFSVCTPGGKEIAESRGFIEVKLAHLTGNQQIPSPIHASIAPLLDRSAPSKLTIPSQKLGNLFKLDNKTYAIC
jgi:hypothetical protein